MERTAGPSRDPCRPPRGTADPGVAQRELARAREAALAWRNGLAALFVGLLGFGLIKGRTDVGKLASPYDALVGGAAAVPGVRHARRAAAAPGGARGTRRVRLPAGVPAAATALHLGDHMETRRTVRALTRGVVLTIACGAMLVAGVALTWYGPEKDGPRILVRTPSGDVCGKPVRTDAGRLLVKTDTGEVTVRLAQAEALAAVDDCPGARPPNDPGRRDGPRRRRPSSGGTPRRRQHRANRPPVEPGAGAGPRSGGLRRVLPPPGQQRQHHAWAEALAAVDDCPGARPPNDPGRRDGASAGTHIPPVVRPATDRSRRTGHRSDRRWGGPLPVGTPHRRRHPADRPPVGPAAAQTRPPVGPSGETALAQAASAATSLRPVSSVSTTYSTSDVPRPTAQP
ncbi:hypothetical protein O1M54_10860 [Streptomyces diastatochromogenes]|nr:hypothetical protein [Streptomyces diastatochromogenes]